MQILHTIAFFLLGLSGFTRATESYDVDYNNVSVSANDDPCYDWVYGGDAETATLSDWFVFNSGEIKFDYDAPLGSSRSFNMTGRTHVNAGPYQSLDVDCLEQGKQYKISAKIKITDEDGTNDVTCNKYAEWLDTDFCPLFTISITTSTGVSKLNLGNDMVSHVEWNAGEWNPYNAVFTIDDRLALATDAFIHIRGSRPGVNICFDDVSVTEYLGEDTRYNYWTSAPTPETKNENECISCTAAESSNATMDVLIISNYTYQYYGINGGYDSSGQCALQNGDADSGLIDGWISMGSEGGSISMHNVGPGNSTKAFIHVDRPHHNSGPGQEDLDLECFELNQRYELKAKIKLVDGNGFPYQCEKSTNHLECDNPCPIFTFLHLSDGEEQYLPLHNNINNTWIAEEFNEYYAIFEVTQTFLDSHSAGLFINGVKEGVGIIFDDVSLIKYTGSSPTTTIPETDMLDGPCTSFAIRGNSETGDMGGWEIKDIISGDLVIYPEGPGDKTKSFQHKGRSHVSSGPGQDLNVGCLVEGKQYILRGYIKIMDEVYGEYACDKYGVWLDPDFCPLFTIWVDEGEGKTARFNIGNDYPNMRVWQEKDWNPYYAIFTVDERLAATDKAYLYLRGPRPNATMMFSDVSIQEYVGMDTRYNFWVSPTEGDAEVSYEEIPADNAEDDHPTVPDVFEYKYYHSTYALTEASTDPCIQLVENGDAENGVIDGWNVNWGELRKHMHGPMDSTMSFLHVNGKGFYSGVGQTFNTSCLKVGQIYEIKAKLKLFDENGFPFRCVGNYFRHSRSCPHFFIDFERVDGTIMPYKVWNDVRRWYADWFNEFHGFFEVNEELATTTRASWMFVGRPLGTSLAFDDVSIKMVQHNATSSVHVDKPEGCQALTYNGDAKIGSLDGWKVIGEYGHVVIDSDGPDGKGPSFKKFGRHMHRNGPGQMIDSSCLKAGRKYRMTAKFFLEDARGNPIACKRLARPGTPRACPQFHLHYFQPWGHIYRIIRTNRNGKKMVPGWNNFDSTLTILKRMVSPRKASLYFAGLKNDVTIYFNDVKVEMIADAEEDDIVAIPPKDPDFLCIGYCCEMVSNGDAESGHVNGWISFPKGRGSIVLHETGADGSDWAIKQIGRRDINSGPGQFLDTNCFVVEKFYKIQAKIMLLNEEGEPTSCNKNATWADATFCPLFSILIMGKTPLKNLWFDVPNDVTKEWISTEFNSYHGVFQINADFIDAKELSFIFRGAAPGMQIVIDSVSFSPYQHHPDYTFEGYDPEFDLFAPSSSFKINPYTRATCVVPVVNGDFEMGDILGWIVNNGGKLSILRCEENGGTYCLQHSQRTSPSMGPKAILDLDCMVAGRNFEISAKIKLMDESWEPIGCEKNVGSNSTCPILTIQYTTAFGEEKWMYTTNRAFEQWNANEFNDYYGVLVVTEELANAAEAYFYFERPPAGVIMILDNVEMKEFVKEADEFYKEMTSRCEKFVINGNAESGELRGWNPRLGGDLILLNEGADLTRHSIMHTGRKSFMMGPKHDIALGCLTQGMRYNFEAKMKLIDDETGQPFECDKTHVWIDDLACPLLTFEIVFADGRKKWFYYNNKTKGKWKADKWNFFQASFDVNEDLARSQSGIFYLERVRAGISIVIDEVQISRDCSFLVSNWDAEDDSLSSWKPNNGGEISIVNGGSNRGSKAFAYTGRFYPGSGPKHMLDIGCLTVGSKYSFTAQIMLLDADNNNTPVRCKIVGCPRLTLDLNTADQPIKKLRFKNNDDSEWIADQFNNFEVILDITEEIHAANSVNMILNGPRGGVSILFDEVDLKLIVEGNCENLIPNGHFENNDEMENWSIAHDGRITISDEGANGSNSSLMCSGRLAPNDGPMSKISHMCMHEGLVYEFKAYLKLLDKGGNPFKCDKTAPYGSTFACPSLGIEMTTPTNLVMVHPENSVDDEWVADEWNLYKTIFIISNDLANAEMAHFKFKGPDAGITILVDDISTKIYEGDKVDCVQLIPSTNAESGSTGEWQTTGGGYIELFDGGDNSTKAFAHYGRGGVGSGPKTYLPTKCLKSDQIYELNARIMFIDNLGAPVGCNKQASWLDPDFCGLATLEYLTNGGDRATVNIGNNFGGPWIENGFNSFRGEVTIDKEMAQADFLYLYFQGPSEEKNIVFDNISMKEKD